MIHAHVVRGKSIKDVMEDSVLSDQLFAYGDQDHNSILNPQSKNHNYKRQRE